MMYVLPLNGQNVLVTQDQLDTVVTALLGAKRLSKEYRGRKAGDDGTDYSTVVRPFDTEEHLQLKPMVQDRYEALVLKTKLEDESK